MLFDSSLPYSKAVNDRLSLWHVPAPATVSVLCNCGLLRPVFSYYLSVRHAIATCNPQNTLETVHVMRKIIGQNVLIPRSPWQPLVVWLPDLHGKVLVHVSGEFCGPHGPAAVVQSGSWACRDARDPSGTVALYEAFSPSRSHQGHLPPGQQCYPSLWCHRLPYTNPYVD